LIPNLVDITERDRDDLLVELDIVAETALIEEVVVLFARFISVGFVDNLAEEL